VSVIAARSRLSAGSGFFMAEASRLMIEIVPLRTEEDRLLFGMWSRNVCRMLIEIILENRGLSKGEIDELMGFGSIDRDRIDNPGVGDLAGLEFSEAAGLEG